MERIVSAEVRIDYSKLLDARAEDFEELANKVRPRLMPRPNVDYTIELKHKPPLREGETHIAFTVSACPECLTLLTARIFERGGKVWIRKVCPRHGEFEEVYWGSYELYRRFREWQFDGKGITTPHVPLTAPCPMNCGLCPRHKSHPALINLVATNRCDLSCWYCFFFAERAGYVYEPTLEHIRYMLRRARELRPYPAIALQITGGEPTLRDDLVDIVRLAKELGYTHVQVNTTGIKLAFDSTLAVRLREAGTNVIYMSFDGVTPYTNAKNHWEAPYALDNLREARLPVVLVPTVIKGYNLHEVWDMIRFGLKHTDVVRGVNFQPVSITGRVPRKQREKMRVTIPDVLYEIEKQSGGALRVDDWYPVPSVAPVSHFVEAITSETKLELTTHFACGAATYLFKDNSEIVPITRFVDVSGFLRYLEEKACEIKSGRSKYIVTLETIASLRRFVDLSKAPRRLRKRGKALRHLFNILIRHNYSSLGEFHYDALFVGMMHFQDLYNHDAARVQRCDIHYVTPDGRLVPFCSFNVIPELYRDRVQRAYSIPLDKWAAIKGLRLRPSEYKYRRNIKKLIAGEPYRRHYEGIIDVDAIPYEDHVMASKRFGIPVVE
mgnify:FL=1